MSKKLYYIENKSTNPYFNLALEEFLLTQKTESDFITLWQNDNTIVIGNNQNAYEEINTEYVKANNITVVRRITGGGAVYHDLGNLNFSFITQLNENESFTINDFVKPVIRALNEMGIDAEVNGRNDITVNNQKISGNAQRIYKNRILHHGTLLFNSNVNLISNSLSVKPEKFLSKSTKSVESRVTNIANYISAKISVSDFKAMLLKSFSQDMGIENCVLTEEDIEKINQLANEKYSNPHWTFRTVQPMDIHSCAKFDGGYIEINLKISDNKITNCNIFGDFMSVCDITLLTDALCQTIFSPDEIKKAISPLPLKELIGEITADEFVRCVFQ